MVWQYSGAGFLSKKGIGTLIITSEKNTYTGATIIEEGALRAGAVNSLSNSSSHQVNTGATLDLAGYNQTLSRLENSGTVNLSGAMPGTRLTLTGPYIGNNGQLGISTVLGDDRSTTDQLLLSGPNAIASGHSTLSITNVGGLGAQTTGNGIEVIKTENGASIDKNAFSLASEHIDVGAYEYRLYQNENSIALKSTKTQINPEPDVTTYRQEVPLISALASQIRQGDIAMLSNKYQRVGMTFRLTHLETKKTIEFGQDTYIANQRLNKMVRLVLKVMVGSQASN